MTPKTYLASLFLFCVLLCACNTATARPASGSEQCATPGRVQQTAKASPTWPAASEDWPLFRGNLSRTGSASSGASKLKMAWTFCTGGPIFASPVVQAGIAYVASTDRTVAALDIQHARLLWQFQANAPIYSTPLIDQHTLYVAALSGTIYALNASSGQVIWQTKIGPAGANLWSSPSLAQGLLMLGVASSLNEKPKVPGQLIALDARTGELRWRTYTQPSAAPGAGVWSSPAVDLKLQSVYVGTGDPDDGVQAFALNNGRLLWHWRSVAKDVADTDVGAGPLLYTNLQGQERVVVGGKNGFLYSLNAQTGQLLWQKRVDEQIYASPALAQGILYAVGTASGRSTCLAIEAETGHQLWQFVVKQKTYTSPVISGNTLYLGVGNGFGSGNGGLAVLDARTGQLLQQLSLQTTASSSPTVLANWLLLGTNDGSMQAFIRQ